MLHHFYLLLLLITQTII